MGRIKQTYLKRVAKALIREYPEDFNTEFENNKNKVAEHLDIKVNNPIRNKIAGSITRMVKTALAAE